MGTLTEHCRLDDRLMFRIWDAHFEVGHASNETLLPIGRYQLCHITSYHIQGVRAFQVGIGPALKDA